MLPILDERLSAAASMVRAGVRFADIGSDHAYLPIYLCSVGKVECALASDINKGPVAAAVENIAQYGVEGKVTAILSDGLCGARDFSPEDIAILGMGGELIVSIIDKAEWVKDKNIRLILQPMTHAHTLTKYLLDNGFSIVDEKICATLSTRSDRIYRVIAAEYSENKDAWSDAEYLIGKINIERAKAGDKLTRKYIQHTIDVYNVRINGKAQAGSDATYEINIVKELEGIL